MLSSPCRRSRRRHPACPPGVRHRPAGRGAPRSHAPARDGAPGAGRRGRARPTSASTSSRPANTPGWPEMPPRRGRATLAALAVRHTDLGALVGLARIDAFDGRTSDGDRRAPEGRRDRPTARDARRCSATCWPRPATPPRPSRQFETVRFIERLGEIAEHGLRPRAHPRSSSTTARASDALLAKAQASLAGATRHVRSRHRRLGALSPRSIRRGRPPRSTAAAADGAADARLLFHRGAIALGRGDAAGGRAALQAALALGPALDPIERAEAQRLLGQ